MGDIRPLRTEQHEGEQSSREASSVLLAPFELLDAAVPEALKLLSYVNPFIS